MDSRSRHSHRWVLMLRLKRAEVSGSVWWHTAVPAKSRHDNTTPRDAVTDGERVSVLLRRRLFAFDMDGKALWSKLMEATETLTGFGHAQSPVVDDRHVYILNDNEERSFIAAYDKRTGNQIWRVDRKETSKWTTPLVWKNERRTEIVTAATRCAVVRGTAPALQLTGIRVAVPARRGERAAVRASGYSATRSAGVCDRMGRRADISLKSDETRMKTSSGRIRTLGTFHQSRCLSGCYYVLHDRGFLTARRDVQVDLSPAGINPRTPHFTSPWAYNGRCCVSEDRVPT